MTDSEDRIYDVVTVGERGQVVIPAKARKDFDIKPGEKLMVVKGEGNMGIILVKMGKLSNFVSTLIAQIGKVKKMIKGKP